MAGISITRGDLTAVDLRAAAGRTKDARASRRMLAIALVDADVILCQGHHACPCTAGWTVGAVLPGNCSGSSRSADEPQATLRVQSPKVGTGSRLPHPTSQISMRQGPHFLQILLA